MKIVMNDSLKRSNLIGKDLRAGFSLGLYRFMSLPPLLLWRLRLSGG